MNKTHFVSAGGNLVVKPKSARILVNHKFSSEDELFVPSPKATSSTPSLLNMESDHGESRRCSTVDGYRSPLPRESRRSSRRISDSTNWEKTSTKQAASGNELSKSDKGAAGRRRAARDKLANSENTPKQAPTDGLSKCNHDLSRSKVLSNSNHDDSKSGHSRPRSRRDILSTSGHGRRSGQSPAHLLSNSSSHSAPESGLNQMINQQLQHLQQQVQLLQQQQQQQHQHSQHRPQQQPQVQEGGQLRSRRNVLSNSGHSRNKSHSSGLRSQSNPRRRRLRDDFSNISNPSGPMSPPQTIERLSKSDHGGRRTRRHNDLGASSDPKTTTPISSKCMEIKVPSALEDLGIAEFSVDDEKEWDLGKSWGFESFAEAGAEAETIWSRIA